MGLKQVQQILKRWTAYWKVKQRAARHAFSFTASGAIQLLMRFVGSKKVRVQRHFADPRRRLNPAGLKSGCADLETPILKSQPDWIGIGSNFDVRKEHPVRQAGKPIPTPLCWSTGAGPLDSKNRFSIDKSDLQLSQQEGLQHSPRLDLLNGVQKVVS